MIDGKKPKCKKSIKERKAKKDEDKNAWDEINSKNQRVLKLEKT